MLLKKGCVRKVGKRSKKIDLEFKLNFKLKDSESDTRYAAMSACRAAVLLRPAGHA